MTMQEVGRALGDVADVVERIKADGRNALLTLKNGVVLRCKPVPPVYVQALRAKFVDPDPPKVTITPTDGRDPWEEENPSDPAYQRQLSDWHYRGNMAINRLFWGMGTELVSVPEGMFRPEDQGWIDYVKRAETYTGEEVPVDVSNDEMRWVSWLSLYAIDNDTDLYLAGSIPQNLAGINEKEVADAVAAFRSVQERRADSDIPPATASSNGHSANRTARRSRK